MTDNLKAAIVVACRDAAAREVLTQELGKRYGGDYAIVVCDQPGELESRIRGLLASGTPVALVIGGVGAQDPDGIETLAATRAIDPTASRVPPFAGGSSKPRAPSSTPSPWARLITGSCSRCRPRTRTSTGRSPGS